MIDLNCIDDSRIFFQYLVIKSQAPAAFSAAANFSSVFAIHPSTFLTFSSPRGLMVARTLGLHACMSETMSAKVGLLV